MFPSHLKRFVKALWAPLLLHPYGKKKEAAKLSIWGCLEKKRQSHFAFFLVRQ